MIAIRQVTLVDAKRLLEIYDYYVKNTAITFEYDTPSLAEFQSRMERWGWIEQDNICIIIFRICENDI